MKYHYKKGTIERDVIFITMIYVVIICMAVTGYSALRAYVAEGRLANQVYETRNEH